MIFFSTHLPSNSVPEAGQKICNRHLQDLTKVKNVHLVSFVNEMEDNFVDERQFEFCASTHLIRISNARRLWNLFFNLLLPAQLAVRADRRALDIINNLLEVDPDQEIFLEYEQAAVILPRINKRIKSTVVFHDVISQSIQRRIESLEGFSLKRIYYRYQLKLIVNWERRLSGLVDRAIVLNEKDKSLLIELGFGSDLIDVDYPLVSEKFHAASRRRYEPETILFWGAMNRFENENAVLWFMTSIYPHIKKTVPGLKFIILGANPGDRIQQLACDDIEVTGFVDDPIPYFERAALAVAPLRYGAGVKLKVLEAIAAKLPVVGTSVAAEGVVAATNELEIADDEVCFAQKVIDRLSRDRAPSNSQEGVHSGSFKHRLED